MSYINSILKTPRLTLKNRLIMPPMATHCATEEGQITQQTLDYYKEKSQGGYLSMIITEHSYVTAKGRADKQQISIAEEQAEDGLKKLVQVIHQNGTKAVAQINHCGARSIYGGENEAPSPVHSLNDWFPGKKWEADTELPKERIAGIAKEFAEAALRAKRVGYDGVEIHSAHGYLLNQFYSPLTNLRRDEYGGNLEKRLRIHLEVIQAVRKAVGETYPIFLRLGACDYHEGGSTIPDAVEAAAIFEKAGIDILDISGGLCGYTIQGKEQEQGYFQEITRAIKEKITIPVILTGGITEVKAAEQLLKEGAADLIGVGRAIYKDSKWAEKAFCQLDEKRI